MGKLSDSLRAGQVSATGRGNPAQPATALGRVTGSTLVRHLAVTVGAGLVLFLVSRSVSDYANGEIAKVATFFTAVAGLTILTGLNGQISLGHGALMAIGGYLTAVLTASHGWPLWQSWILAVVFTASAGALLGAGAARLRGPYLAGATLALAVAVPGIGLHFASLLGGETGLSLDNSTNASAVNLTIPGKSQMVACTLAALLCLLLLANLTRSRVGRSLRAVRDDEVAAQLAGLSVGRTQVLAFVVSSAAAGLSGAMFATVNNQVSPGAFTLTLSLQLLTAVVLGGLGSLAGALWGSIFLVVLPHLTNGSNSPRGAQLSIMIYGAVLSLVMIFFPGGIQGLLRRLADRVLPTRRSSGGKQHPSLHPTEEESA